MDTNAAAKPAKEKPAKGMKTSIGTIMKESVKGTLISMIFSVAAILLFALIIKETKSSDSLIAIINQIIKIGGIMLASYFAAKGLPDRQWIAGGITGVMYILLSYLIYSLIEGMFGNVGLLFSNLLMGLLIGAVFAIITANFLSGPKKARAPKPGKRTFRRRAHASGK
jgi:putative membrane protein (TIGR04086 family)